MTITRKTLLYVRSEERGARSEEKAVEKFSVEIFVFSIFHHFPGVFSGRIFSSPTNCAKSDARSIGRAASPLASLCKTEKNSKWGTHFPWFHFFGHEFFSKHHSNPKLGSYGPCDAGFMTKCGAALCADAALHCSAVVSKFSNFGQNFRFRGHITF
jgi:hypothetical protein